MTNILRSAIQAQQALFGYTRRHAKRIVEGDLGNNAGVVDHPTRTNYVYVHLHGDDNQIIEAEAVASFPHTAGIIVAVEEIKRTGSSKWKVLGIADNILYPSSIWAGTVGEHASQHQRRDLGEGGFDPLDIYNRALVNLRARAQTTPDMTLYVQRGFYFIGGALFEWTGGNSGAFTAPASSPFLTIRRCDLLYIGSDNALHIVTGATTSDGSLPPYPTTPTTCIPIAYVYLTSNTTIIEEEVIKDARVILTASDATAAAHNLLSAIHGDTLAASVADGAIIIGNVTPKWSLLAISIPAAGMRNSLSVDNGELRPSWKAILDTANPVALGVAAPGTRLVSARGDHVHPTTNLALLNASNLFTQNQYISNGSPALNLQKTPSGAVTSVTYSQINAPDAAGGSGAAGSTYSIIGGIGDGAGTGGNAVLQGGNGGATGPGGSISGSGGSGGATSGDGGNCTFNGGSAVNGNSNGGSVVFNVGLKSGAGTNGILKFGTGGADFAIMGIGGISGGDKTFTFPNVTGTFALGAGTITNATTNDVTVAAHTHAVSGTFAATAHDIAGATHTIAGAALSLVGATALNTLGLITPSDDVSGGTTAVLKSNAGQLTLAILQLGTAAAQHGTVSVAPTRTTIDWHGFEDVSALNTADTALGYAAFDAKPTLTNNLDQNHFVGFQSRPIYAGAGNLTNYLHSFDATPVHNGAGTIANNAGLYITDIGGVGPVTNDYGLYIGNITRGGTLNYSIYSAGGNCYIASKLGIGVATNIDAVLHANGNVEVAAGGGFAYNIYYSGGWKYSGNGLGFIQYATGSDLIWSVYTNNAGGHGAAASEIQAIKVATATGDLTALGSATITNSLAHKGTLAGFYNTSPVAQQTGDIVAGLNNLGLFTAASLKASGIHHSKSITYISGTGTAGADNTAQTVKTLTLAANSLTQVGDRMRIRAYWRGDTGAAITGSCKIGPAGSEVLVSHTTDSGGATLQLNEVWLHYIDNTHANIIENEAGALGALSAANTAGFAWNGAHAIIFTQDAIANNHTVLYALIVDIFPKGVI